MLLGVKYLAMERGSTITLRLLPLHRYARFFASTLTLLVCSAMIQPPRSWCTTICASSWLTLPPLAPAIGLASVVASPPYGVYRCAPTPVSLAATTQGHSQRYCA